jgi:predicted nucleic acid-binding protein
MIAEYNEVLTRSRFGVVVGFVREFLDNFQAIGETILQPAPYLRPVPDPSDLPFIEVAIYGRANAIVTGNLKHYRNDIGVIVLSPTELVERLKRQYE